MGKTLGKKSKRKKYGDACRNCRNRHVKCNGSPPNPCPQCVKRGVKCVYSPTIRKKRKTKKKSEKPEIQQKPVENNNSRFLGTQNQFKSQTFNPYYVQYTTSNNKPKKIYHINQNSYGSHVSYGKSIPITNLRQSLQNKNGRVQHVTSFRTLQNRPEVSTINNVYHPHYISHSLMFEDHYVLEMDKKLLKPKTIITPHIHLEGIKNFYPNITLPKNIKIPYEVPRMPEKRSMRFINSPQQNTMNNRQFYINILFSVFAKPQPIYLLGYKQLSSLVDLVFTNVFQKPKRDLTSYSQQTLSFLKLFYALFANCFIQCKDTRIKNNFIELASDFAKKSEAVPVTFIKKKSKAFSFAKQLTKDEVEEEIDELDDLFGDLNVSNFTPTTVENEPFLLEHVYSNLFLARYSYCIGAIENSIKYAELANNVYKTDHESTDLLNNMHQTNTFFQARLYLVMNEYYCILANLREEKDPIDYAINPNDLNYGGKNFEKLKRLRDLEFKKIQKIILQKKSLEYGEINVTIITALLCMFRVERLKKPNCSRKEILEKIKFLYHLKPFINNSIPIILVKNLEFVLNSLFLQLYYLIGETKQIDYYANLVLLSLKDPQFVFSDFLDSLTMFFVSNYFYGSNTPGNKNYWIQNTRLCISAIKRQKCTNDRLNYLFRIFFNLFGYNIHLKDLFSDVDMQIPYIQSIYNDSNHVVKREVDSERVKSNRTVIGQMRFVLGIKSPLSFKQILK